MIVLERLGLAYRKAKVDLYYSTQANLRILADYEDHLKVNLSNLLQMINADDETWVTNAEFTGSWKLAPKSIELPKDPSDAKLHFSSSKQKWNHYYGNERGANKPVAQFRLMAQCSMDFHVLSALWTLEVGHLFDAALRKSAYGNRLRRIKDSKDFNELSLGSFEPYLKPFQNWRDTGMETISRALDDKQEIVAITADVSSFYHELNAGFMTDLDFIEGVLGLSLDESQLKLNRLFIAGLQAWANETPLKKGLPVGLPASAIIANVALIELDRAIDNQVSPLYYGRYVDDILLVIRKSDDFQSTSNVWEWLFKRSNGLLKWADEEHSSVSYCPDYLDSHSCKVHFSSSKNKIFLLSGDTGKSLLESIKQQIHERASEWRSMPRIPRSAGQIGADILSATQSTGEAADSLRSAASLTIRRSEFAIRLRDMEAYERDLQPEAWREHREAFISAFIEHVMALPIFFELSIYLPRVVKLATACEDFILLRGIFNSLNQVCETVEKTCKINVKACPKIDSMMEQVQVTNGWQDPLFESFWSAVASAFPTNLSKISKMQWNDAFPEGNNPAQILLQQEHYRLFSYDLAHMPARFKYLSKEIVSHRGIQKDDILTASDEAQSMLPSSVVEGQKILSQNWLNLDNIPKAFLFATRPFSIAELSLVSQDMFSGDPLEVDKIVRSLRGFTVTDRMPRFSDVGLLKVPDSSLPLNCRVGVSSWKTTLDDWAKAVDNQRGNDFERYNRFNDFIDRILADPADCRYLILPELALPANWFVRTAQKLQGRRISLISGIEYLHAANGVVHNQVWAALSHDGLGFPSFMIYRQDKQKPAIHEEQELQRLAGLRLEPKVRWTTPPIIQHGSLRFSMIVCSELTNISYRASLCGKIDALFVPEWNQDIETFNALVEAAALDIPAYVVQCNDRQYGDSRIRAPFKSSWKRDLLRVKGGVSDYCVIGEMDIVSLRQFQSSHRSPNGPFKPVPDGFEICPSRRVTPKAE
jgi:hypothetical protein